MHEVGVVDNKNHTQLFLNLNLWGNIWLSIKARVRNMAGLGSHVALENSGLYLQIQRLTHVLASSTSTAASGVLMSKIKRDTGVNAANKHRHQKVIPCTFLFLLSFLPSSVLPFLPPFLPFFLSLSLWRQGFTMELWLKWSSLCRLGELGTHRHWPATAYQVLGLKTWSTTPDHIFYY